MSKRIIKIAAIKDVTAKGYQTIQCSVSNGPFVNSKPSYILSTPEAIKEHKLEVGLNITAMCDGMVSVVSESTDIETGEVLQFNWLEVK